MSITVNGTTGNVFPTWIWQAPVPRPTDGKLYIWNEPTLTLIEMPT